MSRELWRGVFLGVLVQHIFGFTLYGIVPALVAFIAFDLTLYVRENKDA